MKNTSTSTVPKAPAATAAQPEHRLSLREVFTGLHADGMITREQARDAEIRLASRGTDARHPLEVAAEFGWDNLKQPGTKLTLDALVQWLATWSGLAYQRIDPLSVDVSKVAAVMSYPYAQRWRLLPLKVMTNEVVVATCEPFLREWERDLAPVLQGKAIRRVVASPPDIDRYQIEFYALARSVKGAENERSGVQLGNIQNLEQLMELGRAGKLDANDQHVVAIVDWLLQYAFEQRASDIHLEPRRNVGNVRFRIDGVLHDVYQMPAGVFAAVTSRIKIVSRLDVAEKRKPQDGRIKTRSQDKKEIELRVSSLPTAFGEKLVMRIFDPEVLVRDFSELGFTAQDSARWKAMIAEPNGIILVTGPTGSGKTTTLYSTLKQLATSEVNVCTIEDPIELVEPLFNQMQVQPGIDLTFATGVRALMRQDPDIIMVGEVRDLETAEIAVQAALTGHLVLSTLHTNDAPTAVTRLLDLGVPSYLLKATVIGIVAQRLLRKLCPHCRKPVETPAEEWRELVAGWPIERPRMVHRPVGCLECRGTGYLGRVGIYEILPMSQNIRQLVHDQTDLVPLRSAGIVEGMVPLRIAGSQKVWSGLTSIEEVLRNAPSPPPKPGAQGTAPTS